MKRIFIFFCSAFLIFNSAFCYGQEIEWQNSIGGSKSDMPYSIVPTADKGFICGGSSLSNISGDKTANNYDTAYYAITYDYWLVKLDSLGHVEWDKTFGGTGNDILKCVKQTPDGGYILGGNSRSPISGDKTEPCLDSLPQNDYWIIKTDAAGNIQWQNTIGGNQDDELSCISLTTDNGYICGGSSNSEISFDKTEPRVGFEDYWIVKLDSTGQIEWDQTYGGTKIDQLLSISQTTEGGFVCGGTSESNISGDKHANSIGNLGYPDYWIIKLNAIGQMQWQKTIGGDYGDQLYHIIQTNDGGYICGGYSHSNVSGFKTENAYGERDFWIVKLDSTGSIQWQKTIGSGSYDALSSLIVLNDGSYVCGGSSEGNISGIKTENNCPGYVYNYDTWIIKLSQSGNIQWQNTIGGSSNDHLMSICQSADGGIVCAISSDSPNTGDKTDSTKGDADFWIVKLNNESNFITGNVFSDLNYNNVQEINEPAIANNKVTAVYTNHISFTDQDGFYSILLDDSGTFTVTPKAINYFNPNPTNYLVNFTSTNLTDSLNNFAFQPTGIFNDLCISITPIGAFRNGFNANYIINYQNSGTTTLSGDVVFFPDNNVSYVSSNTIPSTISIDSVVWNTGLLSPFQTGSIIVTIHVNTGTPIGTLINSNVRIEPVAGDANPGCNYHSWEVYTIGSYDPNDILVNEDTLLTTQLPSQTWLDYIIRFQNTGNDTAFTVNILNPIDTTKLELSSIEFVNSSHPVNLNWIPWERNMEFKFNNILLPDSNVNEPLSHGFVHYRIKPKTTLLVGDSITNNAYVYFDFNAPVATNTVVTKIILPTGIAPLSRGEGPGVRCFPNPAKDEITIAGYALQNNQPAVLKIYDVMGKEIFSQPNINHTSQIVNLKSFTSGVYFVQLQTGVKVSRVKFIKQ